MRCLIQPIFWFLLLVPGIVFAEDASSGKALIIPLKGDVHPVLSSFIKDEINRAEKEQFSFVILELNAAGEFNSAVKHIVNTIRQAKIPVVSFVPPDDPAPSLARTFILAASHLAAMAPDTKIGSALEENELDVPLPPEAAAEDEKLKAEETTLLKALAGSNGKKQQWVEDLIRKGTVFTAAEAEKLGAIDFVAQNLDTLLEKGNGRTIKLVSGTTTIDTGNIELSRSEPPEILKAMQTLTDPEITQWVIIAGITLLLLDFLVFGAVVPGAVGMILLILMLFSTGILSPPAAGWTFIGLALLLILFEGLVDAMGMIAICGAVSLVFGTLILTGHHFPDLMISDTTMLFAVSVSILVSIGLFFLVKKLLKRFVRDEQIELPA